MDTVLSRVMKYLSRGMPVAGACLLAAQAWGQSPPSIQSNTSIEYVNVSPQLVKVRQAMQNDPLLSQCSLEAKLNRSVFEISGVVPDETAHKRALQLIQAHTSLPILDMLKIQLIRNPHVAQSPYHPAGQDPATGDLPKTNEPPLAAAVAAESLRIERTKPAAPLSEQGYEATGVVIMAQATEVKPTVKETPTILPETKREQPARLTPKPSQAPAGETAHETMGTTRFTGPSTPNTVNQDAVTLGKLRASVVSACGRTASGVAVRSKGTNKLVVEMRVQREADAHDLGPKVLALSELTPYEVELIIQLGK